MKIRKIISEELTKVITEATKIRAVDLKGAVKLAGYRVISTETTNNALKYWANGGDFKKLVAELKKYGGTHRPANHQTLDEEGVDGGNFVVNCKNNNSIYFAIIKPAGKALRDVGYDY